MAPDCACNTTGLAFIKTQEFFVTYCITFVFFVLCVVPFRVQIVDILCKLLHFDIFTGIFMKILCVGNIILGLYWVACECRHSQVPKPKLHKEICEQDQQPLQSALPLKDEYLVWTQTRQTLVIEDNSSPLTPLTIDEPEWKETLQMKKQPESTTDMILEGETLTSQVTPLLGTTPSEKTQIQHRNMPEDISDILGTRVYANCFLLVSAVSGPFTSRLAVCICFSWFSHSEVCAFCLGNICERFARRDLC